MPLTGRPTRLDQVARTRLIEAQAEKAERHNLLESGELVSAATVKAEWVDICIQIRTRLLAVPARIAARHPDPKLIAEIDREIRDALEALADE